VIDDAGGSGTAMAMGSLTTKKRAPNGGARLGGNPYMSLTSVTDSTVTFSYKYVASRTKVWKLVTKARDRISF
jgi:hypothetical protein